MPVVDIDGNAVQITPIWELPGLYRAYALGCLTLVEVIDSPELQFEWMKVVSVLVADGMTFELADQVPISWHAEIAEAAVGNRTGK